MRAKLTASTVAQAKATATVRQGKLKGKPTALLVWDSEVKGFGLRVTPDGVKSYIIQYSMGKHAKAPKRRYTIGRHGSPWTPETARRRAKVLLGEIEKGHEIGKERDPAGERKSVRHAPTVGDLVDEFAVKHSHRLRDQNRLAWFKKEIGSVPLADVTGPLVAHCRDKLLNEQVGRGKREDRPKRSAPTVNAYLASLSHALTVAARDWGWIPHNPILGGRVRRADERGHQRARFLSDAEREALLTACRGSPDPYLYPAVVLAISTGMRAGEIRWLTWDRVDQERGWIILEHTKNKERRGIPLTGAALEALKAHAKVRRLDSPLVFPNGKGEPWDYRDSWEAALKDAKIDNFRFHDLRHTAASYLLMNGASLGEIAVVLGHKTLAMVKRYSHIADTHRAKVVERMNQAVFGKGGA